MLNKWVSIKDIYFISNEITIKASNNNPKPVYYRHIRVGSPPPPRDTYDISIIIDTNKEKELHPHIDTLFKIWIESGLTQHSINTVNLNIKKKHINIVKQIGIEKMSEAIKLYSMVLKKLSLRSFTPNTLIILGGRVTY